MTLVWAYGALIVFSSGLPGSMDSMVNMSLLELPICCDAAWPEIS
jgi:hypothetical protein